MPTNAPGVKSILLTKYKTIKVGIAPHIINDAKRALIWYDCPCSRSWLVSAANEALISF